MSYFSGYQQPTYSRPAMNTGQMSARPPQEQYVVTPPQQGPPQGAPQAPPPPQPPPSSGGPGDWRNPQPITNNKWDDTNAIRQLIEQMMQHGFYNPFGTPGYAQMYQQAGQHQVQDMIGHAENAGVARGLSPEQTEYARTLAGVNAAGGATRGYADFTMQDALSNRDWLRSLIERHYGFNYAPRQN